MKNRVFFPQPMLDVLIDLDRAALDGQELVIGKAGCRYRIVEAARVLIEETETGDRHDLCGKVKSRAFLEELGAELLGNSMLLEDSAYRVQVGFVGLPVGDYHPSGDLGGTGEQEMLNRLHELVI